MKSAARCAWLVAVKIARWSAVSTSSQLGMRTIEMAESFERKTMAVNLFFVIYLFVMIPVAWQLNAAAVESSAKKSITFESSLENGTQVEITVTKTDSNKGTVREKRWRKGKDPTTDEPDSEKTTKIYDISAKSDGSELAGKADVTFKDPIVIFRLNRPDDQVLGDRIETPTIIVIVTGTIFGLKDKTTIYIITEKDRGNLRAFLTGANFPSLKASP